MEKPALILQIETLLGRELHPAPARGADDPVSGVMPYKEDQPLRYALRDGLLAGLNLEGAGLNDEAWRRILALPGFQPGRIEALNLARNELRASPVPPTMTRLRYLDLSGNRLQTFAPPAGAAETLEHLWLYDNQDLETPPPEIVAQGKAALLHYFREREKQGASKVYEAKVLILGAGGAGKTTLARRLRQGMAAPMPGEHESTHGIEVQDLPPFDHEGQAFQAHLWDFGGQEIYHATHQFFLTKRSLYLLVADARKEDTDFDYWLQIIELLGGDSPVIIVQNEKGGRNKDLNETGLRARFSNIVELHHLDLKNDTEKLDRLRRDIQYRLTCLPHVGGELPKPWVDIRLDLGELKKTKHYIDLPEYRAVCARRGKDDPSDALYISQFLHDLGYLLHFQDDPILKRTVILENSWATDGVYAVVDAAPLKQQNGRFTREQAKSIWVDKPVYRDMYDELLQLMLKFEICYKLDAPGPEQYIAPQLLPADEPPASLHWDKTDNLQLRYEYSFMPKGLISRLIVRLHRYIHDHQEESWKTGVILHRHTARAVMLESFDKRNIHVRAQGAHAKELLTIIAEEIDRLNDSYHNLKVQKKVPCNCSECRLGEMPFFHNLDVLNKARARGVATVQCQNSFEQVDVLRLIDNVFVTTFFNPKTLKVFISYSKEDREHLEALKKHLAPLKREEMLLTWDDGDLTPGEEWDKKIRAQLASADIILLLVSADFLATDYIWKEIDLALQRQDRGEAAVAPIIVRPCAWELTPFARLNALPEKGKPITKWENRDEGWDLVIRQIRRLAEKLRNS